MLLIVIDQGVTDSREREFSLLSTMYCMYWVTSKISIDSRTRSQCSNGLQRNVGGTFDTLTQMHGSKRYPEIERTRDDDERGTRRKIQVDKPRTVVELDD